VIKLPVTKRQKRSKSLPDESMPQLEPSQPLPLPDPKSNDFQSLEIEKIIGKRTRQDNNKIEYLIKFKDLSKQLWERCDNKDIQPFIIQYEANLVKSKLKKNLEAEPEEQSAVKTSTVEQLIKEAKMTKIDIEIFENEENEVLFKSGEKFVSFRKDAIEKREFCKAILNIMPSIILKK